MPSNGGSEYLSTDDLGKPDLIIENGDEIGLWSDYPIYNETDPKLAQLVSDCKSLARPQG